MSLFLVGHGTTPDKLKLVTSAAGDVDTFVSYIDYTDADPPVVADMNNQSATITTATTTDILAGNTSASQRRVVKNASITNTHASVSNTVSVILDDIDASDYQIAETVTLDPGEAFKYDEAHGWFKSAPARTALATGAATTASIASHSADTYYLGMPVTPDGISRLRAGSFFRWEFGVSKGAAGSAAPTFNVRYGTGGVVGDASVCLVTLSAQSAATDRGLIVVSATLRVIGSSAVIVGRVALAHQLATTGLNSTTTGFQEVVTVGGSFNSDVANSILGLSVNPGSSGAWVTEAVTLDATNLVY